MSGVHKYCECHPNELDDLPEPLFRLVCHCQTCQKFFNDAYNDECVFKLSDCKDIDLSNVELMGYQRGYSPIKRGKCKKCGKISVCTIKVGPFPKFVMIPSARLRHRALPQPYAHIYYDTRQRDIDAPIKKIGGHLPSQWSILKQVIRSLIRHRSI